MSATHGPGGGGRPCPVYGEALSPQECEKCGGNLLACPIYGDAEKRWPVAEPA